jgi:hypothetical protein
MPKKLRTIKPIPGIPVGTELHASLSSDGTYKYGYHCVAYFKEKELEGFVEEVKEPEHTWYITPMGDVCRVDTYATPNWLRFRTKESGEMFVKALIDSYNVFLDRGLYKTLDPVYRIMDALNDRV